ncbi:MAG: 5'-methylthioadenosine/adenosylhomocysteine nucleosidase [Bacilli bacterium]|nr:5'-methylthioadenosine/adenosylhomocysteine nucleosidase [Bacilli bacterium]
MKKVGIIFAMKEELEETKNKFDNLIVHSLYDLKIYECKKENVICFLVESGIGKVNAARSTQILIDNMKVDYILNVGVAGSISKDVNKCDIVVANKLVQHDFDLTEFGREKGEIPNIGKYIYCDKKLLEIANTIDIETNIKIGVISSGDIFISDEKMGEKINKKFDALCVEMEGASIAQVCHLCNVPFLVIRAISDSPYEKDNHITFEEFLKISSEMASKFILQFLNKID